MQLGVYGERWETLPGVKGEDVRGNAPGSEELFSFRYMRELTVQVVFDRMLQRTLLGMVEGAEKAAKAGDLQAVEASGNAYRDAVSKGAVLATPTVSPLGKKTAIVFVGGWGSSMYQY